MKTVIITHSKIQNWLQPIGGLGYLAARNSAHPETDLFPKEDRLGFVIPLGNAPKIRFSMPEIRAMANDLKKITPFLSQLARNCESAIPFVGKQDRKRQMEWGYNMRPSRIEADRIDDVDCVVELARKEQEIFNPLNPGYLFIHLRKASVHGHARFFNSMAETYPDMHLGYGPFGGKQGNAFSLRDADWKRLVCRPDEWSQGVAASAWGSGTEFERELIAKSIDDLAWMISNGLTMTDDARYLIQGPVKVEVARVLKLRQDWINDWCDARKLVDPRASGPIGWNKEESQLVPRPVAKKTIVTKITEAKKETPTMTTNQQPAPKDEDEELKELRAKLAAMEKEKAEREAKEAMINSPQEPTAVAEVTEETVKAEQLKPKLVDLGYDYMLVIPCENEITRNYLSAAICQAGFKFVGSAEAAQKARDRVKREQIQLEMNAKDNPELAALVEFNKAESAALRREMDDGTYNPDNYDDQSNNLRKEAVWVAAETKWGTNMPQHHESLKSKLFSLPGMLFAGCALNITGAEILVFGELLNSYVKSIGEEQSKANPGSQLRAPSGSNQQNLPPAIQERKEAIGELKTLLSIIEQGKPRVWQKVLTKQKGKVKKH